MRIYRKIFMMIYILLACAYAPAVSAADTDYQYVNTYETKISSKTKTISKATGTHTKTLKHRSNKTYTASCTKTVKEIPITTYKNGIKTEKTYLTVFKYKYAYRKGSKQCRLSKTVLLKRKTEKYYYPKGYIKPRTQTGPKLPKKLANDFTKNGWKIVLDPGMDGYPYNYMGLCVYNDKQLIIRDYQSDTIYHEFGHYSHFIQHIPSYECNHINKKLDMSSINSSDFLLKESKILLESLDMLTQMSPE